MTEFRIGSAAEATVMVMHTNTAKAMKSGSLDVFATPALVALMEQAACNLVEPLLDEDTTSVGISLNISHDAATAVGRQVTAKAVLASFPLSSRLPMNTESLGKDPMNVSWSKRKNS